MHRPQWQSTPEWRTRVGAAIAVLQSHGFTGQPATGLVLGSGLGDFVDAVQVRASASFEEVPGFAGGRVQAHAGRILQADLNGQTLLILQGRPHAYEGIGLPEVVLPVAVMASLGCGQLVLTNAAGGLRPGMRAGELAVLTDLVDLHQADVARGTLEPEPGLAAQFFGRALRVGTLFDRRLSGILTAAAATGGIPLHRAVYASVWGPHYEEPATIGWLRRIGADVVGMSTGPEAAYLRAVGVAVAGLSCITNVAVEHGAVEVSHAEVVQVGGAAGGDFARLLLDALPKMGEGTE